MLNGAFIGRYKIEVKMTKPNTALNEGTSTVKFVKDYTLYVTRMPAEVTEDMLKTWFTKFGIFFFLLISYTFVFSLCFVVCLFFVLFVRPSVVG